MKINQLFNHMMDENVLLQVLDCFGLKGLSDRRTFKKQDLHARQTIRRLEALVPILSTFYLPCKAKLYLEKINDKKAITILRQIVRLFDHHVVSREKNISNRKVTFYVIESDDAIEATNKMKTIEQSVILSFD
jgi:hypothetical protein